ncbi:hypothetical protein PILCRDRAFT_678681 [Piloderma croceum F 1598]|uniref:Uncharacterized protein n=1 Tax=Piloderma croceum (strain F 1598) TaxID=765440 RepID=A0A0C3F665_PILCF|nr:hypothetical protein PILCRDRAFT_678681 [Piloderma croceum F 1598]
MDIYLAGKKTRLGIQSEPSHSSLGSNTVQVVTRDEGTPSFSVSQVNEHCQVVVNNTDGKLPADYHTNREIFGSLKSPTETTNLGSEKQAAAASPMHDCHGRPPSGPKHDDFAVNLIADGAETNEWTDVDVQSNVASNGSAHPNGPASDRRSLLTPPSSLDASQLRHASSSVPSSAFKRPGTRKSRRILRALQQLHKTTDLEVLLTDTAGVVKISQVSEVDEGHVLSSPVASSFSGPGQSNTFGSASGVFSLQSLTWQLLSTHSLPKYSITEKLRTVSMKDLPTVKSRRLHRQRRKAGLRASRDTGLGTLGASTSCANDMLNVAMPMSILPHSGAKETALGASDNPIVVDGDDDVEMTHT